MNLVRERQREKEGYGKERERERKFCKRRTQHVNKKRLTQMILKGEARYK